VPETLTNWAGNVTFRARALRFPTSIDELQALVATNPRVRALGTGHSFNRIADTDAELVSVSRLPKVLELDRETSTVTVSAGMRYGEVGAYLFTQGFALRNLGSLPHISVAGACATGTHGSGVANGSLASAVRAIEMVGATGDVVSLHRDVDDDFPGSVVALGTLGIVTKLVLDAVPAFDVEQYVYDDLPGDELVAHFDEIVERAYSVSLFTDWRSHKIGQVWLKHRVGDDRGPWPPDPAWRGATLAYAARHPLPGMPVANCTQQLGVPGPAYERLPHFRMEFVPSNGDELQSEYLLPRGHAIAAIDAISQISEQVSAVLHVSEIRTIKADDLWLSPAHGHDTVAFHFTWIKDEPAVLPVIEALERQLAPLAARPHWGKLFTTPPDVVRSLYDRYGDFVVLQRRYDPAGKFRNAFIDRYFPPS
jgi:xylitol oxidase